MFRNYQFSKVALGKVLCTVDAIPEPPEDFLYDYPTSEDVVLFHSDFNNPDIKRLSAPRSSFVNIPTPKPKEPRKISQEEAWKLFGVAESVKMNFIPQVMTCLALEWVNKFIDHCRIHRISEWKKHTRVLKLSVENFNEQMKRAYGPAYPAYETYANRYMEEISVDMQKIWFAIGNVANKQIPATSDREAATYLAIIHRIIDSVEDFDKKQDEIIAGKIGEPVHRRQDKMLQVITAMCIAIEEDFNLKLRPDPLFNLDMTVLANRASSLADRIIGEEGVKRQ